ncbi:3-oxoacyl-[acyl-carrier-protein] reductase FabG [Armadillidium vulgare]|nr:3-oxoacyl-[acyl-carrier-protein] reductase FabG [Armadillidium vulgare]
MNQMASLAGKVAIITGASSGIGASTAVLFSKLGASVSLVGRNFENLKAVDSDCAKAGSQTLCVQADLLKENETESIVTETLKKFGKLDILVNNAGILESGSIENTSLEQYDRLMNTNVRSIYHLTMLAVPHLIKTQGNIVNVSSVNGVRSFAGVLAYSMSKATVDQMTRCAALDLAPKKVRVNSVNPGVVVTNLHKRSGLNEEQYSAFLERSRNDPRIGSSRRSY